MNRLIIADIKSPNNRGICTGHFFAVARNYYELFKNRINILVAGGPIYHSQFKDIQMELPYDVCLQEESLWKNKWKYLQNARSLFKQAEEDTIILQQGGVATSFIAIVLFYHCKSKLYLIQYSLEGLDSPIKRLLYYFAKHKIDGIICPNDMVGKGYRKSYCIVPDYIYIDNPKEKTVPYKDKTLVDGMVMNNVPVDVLRNNGCDYMVTIDCNTGKTYGTKSKNAISQLIACLNLMLSTTSEKTKRLSDIIINIDLHRYSPLNLTKREEMIEMGYTATIKNMKQIKALFKGKFNSIN